MLLAASCAFKYCLPYGELEFLILQIWLTFNSTHLTFLKEVSSSQREIQFDSTYIYLSKKKNPLLLHKPLPPNTSMSLTCLGFPWVDEKEAHVYGLPFPHSVEILAHTEPENPSLGLMEMWGWSLVEKKKDRFSLQHFTWL